MKPGSRKSARIGPKGTAQSTQIYVHVWSIRVATYSWQYFTTYSEFGHQHMQHFGFSTGVQLRHAWHGMQQHHGIKQGALHLWLISGPNSHNLEWYLSHRPYGLEGSIPHHL